MDKEKIIQLIQAVIEHNIDNKSFGDKERDVLLRKINDTLRLALAELSKPTLDDYIQVLPYLAFEDGKFGENALKTTDDDWAYVPTLHKFEGKWLIGWVEGRYNSSAKVIEGTTPIEAARNAYDFCVKKGFIENILNNNLRQ